MNYYAKRIAQAVFTLYAVITLSFVLYRGMPSGPVQQLRTKLLTGGGSTFVGGSGAMSAAKVNRLVEVYTSIRPDVPMHVAYFNYMREIILHQDFGRSIWQSEPVFQVLFQAMPWSIFVSVYGLIAGFAMTILLGTLMAYAEGGRFDKATTVLVMITHSIPYYVVGILALSFLAYGLGWFPTGGRMNPNTTPGFNIPFMLGVVHHGALPILTAFVVGFGGRALKMRANSVRVLGEDYLRVARLRGLPNSRIALRYVGRNAILPIYTSFMIGLSALFSSSVIMERIFTYPGVGWYTFGALERRDFPLLMGSLIFFTTITLVGVLIADFTYGIIDPRANMSDQENY
jgi:peptide/nickel transport system permease protein